MKTYIEGIEKDQYWNLYHAHLHSNAASNLQAEEKAYFIYRYHFLNCFNEMEIT